MKNRLLPKTDLTAMVKAIVEHFDAMRELGHTLTWEKSALFKASVDYYRFHNGPVEAGDDPQQVLIQKLHSHLFNKLHKERTRLTLKENELFTALAQLLPDEERGDKVENKVENRPRVFGQKIGEAPSFDGPLASVHEIEQEKRRNDITKHANLYTTYIVRKVPDPHAGQPAFQLGNDSVGSTEGISYSEAIAHAQHITAKTNRVHVVLGVVSVVEPATRSEPPPPVTTRLRD